MMNFRRPFSRHKAGALYRVGILLGANVLSQGVVLIATPFIVALYSPAHFGLLGVYISLLGILAPLAMLRYDAAIPGAPDNRMAASIFILSLTLASLYALLVTCVLLGLRMLGLFPMVSRSLLWWLLPLGVLLTAMYALASSCAVRRMAFPQIARTKVSQTGWMVMSQLLFGWAGWKPGGLLFGHLLGQSGGSAFLLWQLWKGDRTVFRGIRTQDIIAVAITRIDFARLSMPAAMIEAFSGNLSVLAMAYFYSATVAGWVTLLQRTILIPLAVLTMNMSMVNFSDFATAFREDPSKGWDILVKRSRLILLLGLALAAVLALAAPWGIHKFLGKEWGESTTCLYILLPSVTASFIAAPFGCVLDAYHRQDLHLYREITRGALMLAGLALGVIGHRPWFFTLGLISGASVLGSLVYFWQSRQALKPYHA